MPYSWKNKNAMQVSTTVFIGYLLRHTIPLTSICSLLKISNIGSFLQQTSTVPFRSIRQALWPVTALPKFWFQQDTKMAVTACFFWHIGKIFEDFCGIYIEILLLSWFHPNREKRPLDCSGNFFSTFTRLFTIFSMVSAADQNRRDLRDFSVFGNDPISNWANQFPWVSQPGQPPKTT